MATLNHTLSVAEIRSALDYDPDTGILTWRYRPDKNRSWNVQHAGCVVGARSSYGKTNCIILSFNGRRYKAHRIIWVLMTGAWPSQEIDHIDGDGTNNRWANLRLATHEQNRSNNRVSRNNKLGIRGVLRHKNGRYRAYIHPRGRIKHLGYFDTLDEAIAARREAELEHFGEFAALPE